MYLVNLLSSLLTRQPLPLEQDLLNEMKNQLARCLSCRRDVTGCAVRSESFKMDANRSLVSPGEGSIALIPSNARRSARPLFLYRSNTNVD